MFRDPSQSLGLRLQRRCPTDSFLQILEKEIEPAIKELSSCLLYPDSSVSELDECVQKFESAMQSMRSAQRSLQSSMDQVRAMGERLINS